MLQLTTSIGLAIAIIVYTTSMLFLRKKVVYKGKRCYVTGGSSGLGLALSEILVKRGAHVVIVARDKVKLDSAETSLMNMTTSENQVVKAISADLISKTSSEEAFHAACKAFGGDLPDHVFLCAGFAKPGFFVEASEQDMRGGLDGVYWVSAWTAQIAARMMAQRDAINSKIIFVSSFLALTSFVGYSPYSPGKYALRGLADTLRSELILYGIKVHLYCPAGILSPHFVTENQTKPDITKKIEEGDTPISPERSAEYLLEGLDKGYYTITNDLVTDFMRVAGCGSVPGNNLVYDRLLRGIAGIGIPIWRMMTDAKVRSHRAEHQNYLQQKGFY